MTTEQLILLITPFAGIGFVLLALHVHDKITGFPHGKSRGK